MVANFSVVRPKKLFHFRIDKIGVVLEHRRVRLCPCAPLVTSAQADAAVSFINFCHGQDEYLGSRVGSLAKRLSAVEIRCIG